MCLLNLFQVMFSVPDIIIVLKGCISLLCYSVSSCSGTMPYRGFLYYSRAGQRADLEKIVCGPCSSEYFQKLILTSYITGVQNIILQFYWQRKCL